MKPPPAMHQARTNGQKKFARGESWIAPAGRVDHEARSLTVSSGTSYEQRCQGGGPAVGEWELAEVGLARSLVGHGTRV